ncbi:subtilisin-like protein [Penicillium freii]|nr:subtilisin-like protein [Penicillium freii]
MATEDPIDFAHAAIAQVANIAPLLAVEYKRLVCGRLGAELYLVANYIDTAGLDQEKRLRFRISKLLRDVEAICNNGYPLLEAIGESLPGVVSYEKARAKIRRGLGQLTTRSHDAEEVIAHIQKFTKCDRKSSKRNASDDITPTKRITQPERSRHANELVHRALREQMCCTCQNAERTSGVPLAIATAQQATSNSLVQFDMLFSSTPFWNESQLSHWQDIQLLVPSSSNKDDYANIMSAKQLLRVDQGQFCSLIGLGADWRLCLSIREGELLHCFEPLKQIVEHVPGISLAKILGNYYLTARMKLVLAYLIAYSVWQYYDSDWMKT